MFSRYTYICIKQTFQKLLIFIAPIENKLPTVAISGKKWLYLQWPMNQIHDGYKYVIIAFSSDPDECGGK